MKDIIVAAYNNNVLGVVDPNGVQRILIGNGIGFQAKINRPFTRYEDVKSSFVLEDRGNQKKFQRLADSADAGLMLLIEKQLEAIQSALNVKLNENIHVTLLDHIQFAIYRYKNGLSFRNPFDEDIHILYEQEYALASALVTKVNAYCGIKLPRDEVGIVAIHLHSAFQNEQLEESQKKTDLIETTIASLCEEFGIQFDKHSLSYQRMLIHTKLAYERILAGQEIECGMADYIIQNYAGTYHRIEKIMQKIGDENGMTIPQSEICYLVIHFVRIEEEQKICRPDP